ncbi:glycoside hydrolase family 43 protein [Thozetella sp. PMI_491]|nr:glycoside hydrolase family 43 protein [Thozetella sp. PMI_491]
MWTTFLASLLFLLPALVRGYPNPVTCTGDCFAHDPFVIKRASDGKYFQFSTHPGIDIRTSPSLSGPWTYVGRVLPGLSVINIGFTNDSPWAPDVAYIRGVYYLFYALSQSSSQTSAIGYATSSTMDPGSWTDHGAIITSSSSTPFNAIDANLVNGTNPDEFYLQWGSYWGDIYQSRVAINGPYVFASGNQKQIAYDPSGIHNTEGSTIYYHNGYYYLFLSRGVCCSYENKPAAGAEYHVVVCRSSNPTGPFIDQSGASCLSGGGTMLLASHDNVYAPGGQGLFYDETQNIIVFYYHYLDPRIGVGYQQALFGWNQLFWGADGWPTL